MNLLFYYIRIFFISFQFLTILIGTAIFFVYGEDVFIHFKDIEFNEDYSKWLILILAGIAGWLFKDGAGVLFPCERTSRILHEWPGYWRLKVHFNMGVFYNFILVLPCVFILLFNKLDDFKWAWFFCVFSIAFLINASSFYFAKIDLKSILIHISE